MKNQHATGLIRFLRAATLALPLLTLPAVESGAASWQWSSHGTRERITIALDPIGSNTRQPSISVTRTGGTSLLLRFPGVHNVAMEQGASAQNAHLVQGLASAGDGLELSLATPAFGYLVNKSDPAKLVIDIFHDPLGARWTASGELAPAAVAERYHAAPSAVSSTAAQAVSSVAPPAASALTSAVPAPVDIAAGQPAVPAAAPTRKAAPQPVVAAAASPARSSFQLPAPTMVMSEGTQAAAEGDDAHLPVLEASASLRPEMQDTTPVALGAPSKPLPPARQTGSLLDSFGLATAAVAADMPLSGQSLTVPQGERGISPNPQELFGKVNQGGPENWPVSQGLSTSLRASSHALPQAAQPQSAAVPAQPPATTMPTASVGAASRAQAPDLQPVQKPVEAVAAPEAAMPVSSPSTGVEDKQGNVVSMRQTASAPPASNATMTNSTRPVIYMDEAGNIVPKPPEPDKMLAEAERLLESTQYKEAVALLEEIKAITSITPQMREKVLYLISDATESLYAGDPFKGFEPIVSTASEALNSNLRSARVPDALFRLGMTHLRVDNFGEAEGYFKALKRRYSHDMNVPAAFVNLGKAQLSKGLMAQAASNFRQVLQEYPESNVLRDAAVGLVRALVSLGENAEAMLIADFVDKRWTRHYLTDPAFLEVLAQLNLRMGKLDEALQQYWLAFNLDPARESNPEVLATIGDIYLRTDRTKAAFEVFREIRHRYPDSDAARLALLRLAEKGIHDGPIIIDEIFEVFENPGTPEPQIAYRELRAADAQSPRSILAGLKLAMWALWSKQYTDAMGAAADFIDLYPEHRDVEQAREVIMRSFLADLKNSLAEENYGRVLILWNGFPLVRQRYGDIDPALRNALGRGYLERGDDAKAMELFAEFLKSPKNPQYGDTTFALYFNKYLQAGNWNALLDLGDTVSGWEMDPAMRRQLDYALALSAENMGLAPRALPLWRKIAADAQAPLYQRAYATHFLAKDAELRKDIRDAYTYNKDALALFDSLQQERSEKADPERMKEAIGSLMDITEVANRIPEALEWVERYNDYAPEGSAEFPGLRFREARLYRKLGDNAKAKSLLELIVQKNPDSAFAKAAESELRTFNVSRDLRELLPPPAAPQ